MHQFDLRNRTAIITGGAQGLGLGIAKRFIESGAEVIIWDIDKRLIKEAKQEQQRCHWFNYWIMGLSN